MSNKKNPYAAPNKPVSRRQLSFIESVCCQKSQIKMNNLLANLKTYINIHTESRNETALPCKMITCRISPKVWTSLYSHPSKSNLIWTLVQRPRILGPGSSKWTMCSLCSGWLLIHVPGTSYYAEFVPGTAQGVLTVVLRGSGEVMTSILWSIERKRSNCVFKRTYFETQSLMAVKTHSLILSSLTQFVLDEKLVLQFFNDIVMFKYLT